MSRSMAQRVQDDEHHRLALCGLTPDVRLEHELEDFEQRHYDFIFTRSWTFDTTTGGRRREGPDRSNRAPAATFFASGRRDPAPHDAKRAQDVWEGSGSHQGSHVLSPPPLTNGRRTA